LDIVFLSFILCTKKERAKTGRAMAKITARTKKQGAMTVKGMVS
jgi:hypothetical protein